MNSSIIIFEAISFFVFFLDMKVNAKVTCGEIIRIIAWIVLAISIISALFCLFNGTLSILFKNLFFWIVLISCLFIVTK